MINSITIPRADDWHIHFRHGVMLKTVVPYTASVYKRAIVMPNLVPPVVNTDMAMDYKKRIVSASAGTDFEPLMVMYLTDETSETTVLSAHDAGVVAFKLYPAGATTNSDSGVTDIKKVTKALDKMQELGMVLCVHGEITRPEVDIFDREKFFIDEVLSWTRKQFPNLKIVMEHITTSEGADYVLETENMGATITIQHLMINRNHMLVGGIRPHYYCLPVPKRNIHQQRLREVATSGSEKFFLGTDSAPHLKGAKQSACGCAGVFNTIGSLEMYTQVFDEEGRLENLEAFASINGPNFYGLPVNSDIITLVRVEPYSSPEEIWLNDGSATIIPFNPPGNISWKIRK